MARKSIGKSLFFIVLQEEITEKSLISSFLRELKFGFMCKLTQRRIQNPVLKFRNSW
jgi:hypothetical protein